MEEQVNKPTVDYDVEPTRLMYPDPLDYELAHNRYLRNKWIKQHTNNGTSFPQDPEGMEAFSKLLNDRDKQALTLKKLRLEEQASKQNGESAALVAQLLSKISGTTFNVTQTNTSVAAPSLPADSRPETLVEGMLDTAHSNETYDTFMARMQATDDNPQDDN